MPKNLLRPIALLASLAAPLCAPCAETDWLYFPMYARDTAHAVHLSALHFRPDGLLASATRYPRVSDEHWPKEQYERSWYGYEQRLIDCETGYFLETSDSLLDRDSQVMATRAIGHARWVERLAEQLQTRSQSEARWPSVRSEIFLACAGASSPTLKTQRARQAKARPSLITNAPQTQALSADSDALYVGNTMRYDLDRLIRQRPATPAALFDQLRQQHQAWRRSYNRADPSAPAAAPLPKPAHDHPEGMQGVHQLGQGVVEFEARWDLPWGTEGPAQAAYATETQRVDCASGVRVPMLRHWRDGDGKSLRQVPVPVKDALAAVRYAVEAGGFPPVQACQPADPAARVSTPEGPGQPADADLPYGLSRALLAREQTPEAMLLRVRAALRAAQR